MILPTPRREMTRGRRRRQDASAHFAKNDAAGCKPSAAHLLRRFAFQTFANDPASSSPGAAKPRRYHFALPDRLINGGLMKHTRSSACRGRIGIAFFARGASARLARDGSQLQQIV